MHSTLRVKFRVRDAIKKYLNYPSMKKIKINISVMIAVVAGTVFLLPAATAVGASVISVPFTSQAPAGNWAQPWQDFCEEATVVMAAHFLWSKPLTQRLAETEMQIIKQYEEIMFKGYKDTSASQTAMILKNLFGFNRIEVRNVASASEIKKELMLGNIVILPTAGRLLKNPYFVAPGPLYHMILVRGFDDARRIFITNDPGTRRGNGYAYNQDVLMNAVHDWNGGDVMRGEKVMIVVGK